MQRYACVSFEGNSREDALLGLAHKLRLFRYHLLRKCVPVIISHYENKFSNVF